VLLLLLLLLDHLLPVANRTVPRDERLAGRTAGKKHLLHLHKRFLPATLLPR